MPDQPANYIDPPADPEKMGWGHEDFSNPLRLEERDAQESEIACAEAYAKGANPLAAAIEASLREEMQFDEGWSFLPAERRVYGRNFMIDQNMGNCVANSHCCVLASRIAHEILVEGDIEEPLGQGDLALPFIPYSYGAGRHMAGIRGRRDGSTCQGQIRGTVEYGFLPCFTPGLDEFAGTLPQAASTVGRFFGANDKPFREWADHAKPFQLLETPIVADGYELWDCIAEKKIPLQIASNQGFRYWKHDRRYNVHLYRFGSHWSHQMQLVEAFEIKGQRFVTIRNQWGTDAHYGSPEIGVPGGCMVITIEDFDKWIPHAHCAGIGEIQGLKSDWGF